MLFWKHKDLEDCFLSLLSESKTEIFPPKIKPSETNPHLLAVACDFFSNATHFEMSKFKLKYSVIIKISRELC